MNRKPEGNTLNDAQTRYVIIDPALRHAGWNLDDRTQVGFEIPVDGCDAEPWNGVTDYCLYAPGGEVIAVVEAKRSSRNLREADEQLRYYVTEYSQPTVSRLLKNALRTAPMEKLTSQNALQSIFVTLGWI